MGQKVHPVGFRLGYIRDHDATWFADRNYHEFCVEDQKIRTYLDRFNKQKPPTVAANLEERRYEEGLAQASISRVVIGRSVNTVNLTIHSAKPGVIIGRAGRGIELLRLLLQRLTRRQVTVDVVEERNPDLDARLVAEKVASQLSRRISFRRAVRQAVQSTMRSGAQGVKVQVAGRLAGGDMARRHVHKEGKIPLQTMRADIDYGRCEAMTTYGNLGVQAWVYRGERLPERGDGEIATPVVMMVDDETVTAAPEKPAEQPRGRRRSRRRTSSEGAEKPVAETVEAVVEEAAPAMAEAPEPTPEPEVTPAPEPAAEPAADEATGESGC